jgi:hypothetical protein
MTPPRQQVLDVASCSSLTIDIEEQLWHHSVPFDAVIHAAHSHVLRVHLAIVAARSTTLKRLIAAARNTPTPSPNATTSKQLVLSLTDYSRESVECAVLFMYSDKIRAPSDMPMVRELVQLAKYLNLTHMHAVLCKRFECTTSIASAPMQRSALPTLATDLLRICLDRRSSDVCIDVEHRAFHCHRVILAARCQYFRAMFSGDWNESNTTNGSSGTCDNGIEQHRLPVVRVHGITSDAFERAVHYFYTNSLLLQCSEACTHPLPDIEHTATPSPTNTNTTTTTAATTDNQQVIRHAIELFHLSSYLCADDLQARCEDALLPLITEQNLAQMAALAHEYLLLGLKRHCKAFLIDNFERCAAHPSFVQLDHGLLQQVRSMHASSIGQGYSAVW